MAYSLYTPFHHPCQISLLFGREQCNGQFQTISIPNQGRLRCFNPPPLTFGNSRMRFPPCPQNSIIVNPPTLQNFHYFWKFIFDLATPLSTNKHEFMPPQGCDPAAPGDKLYSSATKKTYLQPGCANSLLNLNLAIKINTTYGNFASLYFLVLF